MKFYVVSNDYINHLKKVDARVPDNYDERRAYVGVVMEVCGIKYLVPLTSHKTKHKDIKPGAQTVFKIHELNNEANPLGMAQISNMLPVLDSEIQLLDMKVQSENKKKLLNLQQQFLRKNSERFVKKAMRLYELVTVKKVPGLVKNCCDFKALEAARAAYIPANQRQASSEGLAALAEKFNS
ncbi:hypothetical protein BCT63_18360 [Vibrio kanaloae]|uniref:type III toxin-antitoxin system ToxN/AbiQ family toxin n=1 Tax=Vibrio kanaloae TaxID=170673 RepID=UPI000C82CB72|nr:type III toxin-antitoxin system ToxN/AbiQ family toxin [Vibrio kanaloae]PMM01869.1 hypothetical protein BCT63_18360 [Vibrio kanaloae]